jgi:multiple sugar transport system ATP-binding protein
LGKISADSIVVGIRPECLTLVTEREASATDVSVRGKVEMVEMLGAEQYVHVNTKGGSLTARVPRNQLVRVDDMVILAAAAPDLHLFDHETGSALR